MINNFVENTIESIKGKLEELIRLFLDHTHDGINSKEVESDSSGSFYSVMHDRSTGDGTGNVSIDCGFEPKLIKIYAVGDAVGGYTGWSHGSVTAVGGKCIGYAWSGSVFEKLYSTTKILYVWDSGETNNSQASVTVISSTGFTLNFSAVNINVRYIVEAFG